MPESDLIVLINKAAGTASQYEEAALKSLLAQALGNEGAAKIRIVAPDSLPEAIAAAFKEEAPLVAVGGGDGTVRTAARHAVESGKTLGILPLGTLNLLARDLGIPLDLEAATQLLTGGRERAIDVAEVNGELCLIKAMAGRFSASVQRREKWRKKLKLFAWVPVLLAAFRALFRYPKRRFRIGMDGREERLRTSVLTLSLNRFQSVLDNPYQRDDLAGGRLAVYRFPERGGRSAERAEARLNAALDSGTIMDAFLVGEAQELTLDARGKRLYVSIDGELKLLDLPVSMSLKPQALKVIGGAG